MLAPRTIIVGEPSEQSILNPQNVQLQFGLPLSFKPDFTSIQDAINHAHKELLQDPGYPYNHNFLARYTVLVLPGAYHENIVCYPWINILGLARESTWLLGPDTTQPTITLASNVNVTNVSVFMLSDATEIGPAAIVGGDVLVPMQGIGLTNVDMFPAGLPNPSFQRSLELKNCSSVIITTFQASYFGGHSGRYCIEVHGPAWWEATEMGILGTLSTDVLQNNLGWNADTHFINCFVDGIRLFKPNPDRTKPKEPFDGSGPTIGCFLTKNCYDVHLRNSLIRALGPEGSAVKVLCDDDYQNEQFNDPYNLGKERSPLVNVLVEGSTLYGVADNSNPRVLRVGPRCECVFAHSSSQTTSIPLNAPHAMNPRVLRDDFQYEVWDTPIYGVVSFDDNEG